MPCRRHGGIMRKRADQRGQEDSGPAIGSAHDNVHARAHPNAHVPAGPPTMALTASGVRLGGVFRVLAVAWDVVDSLLRPPAPSC